MKLIKAMATVAGLTGLSRIAGFVRDILTASILGAGPVADAFFVALKLPNLFRRITAEGAFSVSFVPVYSETLEKDGREEADLFACRAFSVMLGILSVFTLLAIAVMPWVIRGIAPGFYGDDLRYDLAVELSRTTFPYLLLMSLTALMGAVLNALDRFGPFAFAPVLFNLTLIAALFLSGFAETAGHAMACGVLAAGFIQFIWLFVSARRHGFRVRLVRPEFSPRIRKVFRLMGPGLIGAGVMQINLFADMIIGSLLGTGAISSLYYADRLNQLPLGMVGIAVGTALLPMLSRTIAAEKMEEARDLFNRALEYCLLLALPAAVGLFVISWPIVMTLFHHGAFSLTAAYNTTAAITAYALGLPAYIAVKVFSTAFWAKHDTATPVKIVSVATAFNILLSLWLVLEVGTGVVGIAVATSLAGWLQIFLFRLALLKREDTKTDERFRRNAWKIVISCIVMGAFLYAAKAPLFDLVYHPEQEAVRFIQILTLLGLVLGGMIIYGAGVVLGGVVRLQEIGKYFKIKT